jgi:hypothetical protein
MSLTSSDGDQIDIGEPIAVTHEDVVQFRTATALMLAAMGVPIAVIAKLFNVSPMTVRRWFGDMAEEHRWGIADTSLRTLFDSCLNRRRISFTPLSPKVQCYTKSTNPKNLPNLLPACKPKTGSSMRLGNSDNDEENRVVWDTARTRGGLGNGAARESPQRVRDGLSKLVSKESSTRARGGTISFRLMGPKGRARDVGIEGLRRLMVVRLRCAGLTWRPIGQFIGRHHATCMRQFDRMSVDDITFFSKADFESSDHTTAKGDRRCLAIRNIETPTKEKTATRTKGRRSGARAGWKHL